MCQRIGCTSSRLAVLCKSVLKGEFCVMGLRGWWYVCYGHLYVPSVQHFSHLSILISGENGMTTRSSGLPSLSPSYGTLFSSVKTAGKYEFNWNFSKAVRGQICVFPGQEPERSLQEATALWGAQISSWVSAHICFSAQHIVNHFSLWTTSNSTMIFPALE